MSSKAGVRWPVLPTCTGLQALLSLPVWIYFTVRAKDATRDLFTTAGLQSDWVNSTTHCVVWMLSVVTPVVVLVVAANVLLAWHDSVTPTSRPNRVQSVKAAALAMIVANWLLLLLTGAAISAMVTWLWDMAQANRALGGDPIIPGFVDGAASKGDAYGIWPLPDFGSKTHSVVSLLLPAVFAIFQVFCAASWLLMYQVAQWVRADYVAGDAAAHTGLSASLLRDNDDV